MYPEKKETWLFRLARAEDVEAIVGLIQQRIDWMDEQGLEQWNKTAYFSSYPPEYFERETQAGHFYVLCSAEKVIGAIALKEQDDYWPESADSCYMHNLATDIAYPGAGRQLLLYCEQEARRRRCRFLRLDCQRGNQKLNDYYKAMGFVEAGTVSDGPYCGIKREKRL